MDEEQKWLARQSFLGPNSDETLAATTVGLVGLGGGGSHVAQQLAHLGIGNFVLVDHDAISATNLNRLVGGTTTDVNDESAKIDIAARLIASVNPSAKIQSFKQEWQLAADALRSCDVVLGGVDSVRAKHELDGFCRRFLIPYIDMGMDVTESHPGNFLISGQVVLTGYGQPCLRCLGIVTDEALVTEARNYGAAGGRPQVVWPNGLLASAAVGLVVQLVTPWHREPTLSAFLEYDGNRNLLHQAAIHRRRRNIPCSHYGSDQVGDPFFDLRSLRLSADINAKGDDRVGGRFSSAGRLMDLVSRLSSWFMRLRRGGAY